MPKQKNCPLVVWNLHCFTLKMLALFLTAVKQRAELSIMTVWWKGKKKRQDNLSPPMTPLQSIHTGWEISCTMHLEAAHVLSADHGNHRVCFFLKNAVETLYN